MVSTTKLLLFAPTYYLASAVAVGVDVYLFRHFEPFWGPGSSFQVLLWLELPLTLLAGAAYVCGARAIRLPRARSRVGSVTAVLASGASVAALATLIAHASELVFGLGSALSHVVDLGLLIALGLTSGAVTTAMVVDVETSGTAA